MERKKAEKYEKHHSFEEFSSKNHDYPVQQRQRVIDVLSAYLLDPPANARREFDPILKEALRCLVDGNPQFKISPFIAEEIGTLEDADLPRYTYHRYRYDVYPSNRILDEYPPYLQIEPSSICNFRCVFCYQTDKEFTAKPNGHMGTMTFELFKDIVDQIQGHVEFISLASRGEPLVCKDIDKMLEYLPGKFLGLKVNTNASLLNERHAHALLAGGVKTVVFSADAAEEPLYSKLRVNGNLERTIRNIEMFQNIRAKHYSGSRIITRVSGVKVSEQQTMDSMAGLWSSKVDQVAFVKYNPWENVYVAKPTDVVAPCSDLWRRMFVWYDGLVNPCDTDYKSMLAVGNVKESAVSQLWRSDKYTALRVAHDAGKRCGVEPCRRCYVV